MFEDGNSAAVSEAWVCPVRVDEVGSDLSEARLRLAVRSMS